MRDAVKIALDYSKASPERMRAMADALRYVDREDIEGDIVECGVWKGGHIILARLMSPSRSCWLFDTFSGMTKPGDHDLHRSGKPALKKYQSHVEQNGKPWAAVSVHEVRDNLKKEGAYDPERIRFVIGDVCQTLQQQDLPDKISVLRLDTDWYESTKAELEILYPRLVSGGVLIVDDYGHWQGCKKAVDEYFLDGRPLEQVPPEEFTPGRFWMADYTCMVWVKDRDIGALKKEGRI